ncbi:hypothetical protein Zmor_004392, partial [Zophobas morio]
DGTLQIVLSAILGLSLGCGLSIANIGPEAASWVKLLGTLFLRSLECIVMLMVFCSMILSIVDMLKAGKAFSIAWKTISLFFFTTILACIEGLVTIFCFKKFFHKRSVKTRPDFFKIYCGPHKNNLLQVDGNNRIICAKNAQTLLNSTFKFALGDEAFPSKPVESVHSALQNEANFLGIITFAVFFGVALKKISRIDNNNEGYKYVVGIIACINEALVKMVQILVHYSHLPIVSLIAGALGERTDLTNTFKSIGLLIATVLSGHLLHFLIVLPTLYFLIVHKNPFSFMKQLLPSQLLAFASSSSAAALPVTIDCVMQSGLVPKNIANFVLSFGATINMDGVAIYFPAALIFLATSEGLEIKAVHYALIVLLSSFASAGAAPIPNAGVVLILTFFTTIFNGVKPTNHALLLAIDWLLDRSSTVVNVTCNGFIAVMVSQLEGGDSVDQEDIGLDLDHPENGISKDEPKAEVKFEVKSLQQGL